MGLRVYDLIERGYYKSIPLMARALGVTKMTVYQWQLRYDGKIPTVHSKNVCQFASKSLDLSELELYNTLKVKVVKEPPKLKDNSMLEWCLAIGTIKDDNPYSSEV